MWGNLTQRNLLSPSKLLTCSKLLKGLDLCSLASKANHQRTWAEMTSAYTYFRNAVIAQNISVTPSQLVQEPHLNDSLLQKKKKKKRLKLQPTLSCIYFPDFILDNFWNSLRSYSFLAFVLFSHLVAAFIPGIFFPHFLTSS